MLETVELLKGCGELVELRENSFSFRNQQPEGKMDMYMYNTSMHEYRTVRS